MRLLPAGRRDCPRPRAVLARSTAGTVQAHAPPRPTRPTSARAPRPAPRQGARRSRCRRRRQAASTSPWDVQSIGARAAAVHPARPRHAVAWSKGKVQRVKGFPSDKIWVSGETGLIGARRRPGLRRQPPRLHLPGLAHSGGGHDVRVIAWSLDDKARNVSKEQGAGQGPPDHQRPARRLPAAHRPRDGVAASSAPATPPSAPTRATSTRSAARRCASTGSPARPWPGNPFAGASTNRRYVHTYGHRNVQGLAERADGSLWSVEHGSDRDDEVNLLVNGGDYGWNPVPGYNESVPMTDHVPARASRSRRSGAPATRPSPPRAARSCTAASGARTTARSRSPASRPAGCCS